MPASLLPAVSASVCSRVCVCSSQAKALETIEHPWPRPRRRGGPSAEDSLLHSAEEPGSARRGSTGCDTAGEAGPGGSACVVCFAQLGRFKKKFCSGDFSPAFHPLGSWDALLSIAII